MDWGTVAIIITLVSCFLGLAGWLTTREKKASNDGEWKGTVNAKLDLILGINNRVDGVENRLDKHETRITKVETKLDTHLKDKPL